MDTLRSDQYVLLLNPANIHTVGALFQVSMETHSLICFPCCPQQCSHACMQYHTVKHTSPPAGTNDHNGEQTGLCLCV